MIITNDPHADFLRHENEQEKKIKNRPLCDVCGWPVQEDYYFEFEHDDCICYWCLDAYLRANYMRRLDCE